MVPSISSPDIEAYRLMRAGRFLEALAFAERAVAGKRPSQRIAAWGGRMMRSTFRETPPYP
jgi:hypothetical protein